MSDSKRPLRAAIAAAPLLGVLALALLVRCLGYEWVLVGDEVVFPPADPQYHARRALYTFTNFPRVLLFDVYINYPGGASISWPPLFDFTVGGMARLLADDLHGFELVAAWAPPIFGVLTVIPIYFIGRRIGDRATGLLAGSIFTCLPISVNYTRIGNADHHSAVALIGAWLLYFCVALVDPRRSDRGSAGVAIGLAVSRLALLLTWHGSLLYLVLAESSLLLAAALTARRQILAVQCVSAIAALVVVVPVLWMSPTPLLGDYSAIALSWLHVLAVIAVIAVSGGLWVLETLRPASGPLARVRRLIGFASFFPLVIMLLPGPREGLVPAFRFLTMIDDAGSVTGEQSPLFRLFGRDPGKPAELSWGYLAYLIPLAPLFGIWHARRAATSAQQRPGAWLLAAWGAYFGYLAVSQRRYGNDFAPAASVLFALGLLAVTRSLTERIPRAALRSAAAITGAALLTILLLWPALVDIHWPRARSSWLAATHEGWPGSEAWYSRAGTLSRFAHEVGRVTPETAAYLEPGPMPEYGIIAHANIGHALQYRAHRPTATDPFWAYIGRENWDRSFEFLAAVDEREALELARMLRGRYVVTMPDAMRGTVVDRLHHDDGTARDRNPALAHFRLVTEAPARGQSIGEIFTRQPRDTVPYKLFEIVPGAALEVMASPGTPIVAAVTIRSPTGREFVHRTRATTGENGLARLTLPYANDAAAPAQATGPYRIEVSGREYTLRVSEAIVLSGGTLQLDAREDGT